MSETKQKLELTCIGKESFNHTPAKSQMNRGRNRVEAGVGTHFVRTIKCTDGTFDAQAFWCLGFNRGTLTPMLFKTLSKTESDPPMFGIGIVMSDGLAVVSSVGVGVGDTAV